MGNICCICKWWNKYLENKVDAFLDDNEDNVNEVFMDKILYNEDDVNEVFMDK